MYKLLFYNKNLENDSHSDPLLPASSLFSIHSLASVETIVDVVEIAFVVEELHLRLATRG